MKSLFAVILLTSVGGCAEWNAAQTNLVTQARKGIANLERRSAERAQTAKELAALRRERLDDAFDQDVRQRQVLDPDWVIQSRKAYEAALDAYAKQQAAQDANAADEQRDLVATDEALAKLEWLQSIQERFDLLPEVFDGKH